MSNRELVLDLVRKLPEDTSMEEIMEKIAFVAGVNEAIAEADRGELIPLEEVEKMIAKWATESS
jgi:predicted transcriptional regulator